MESFNFYLWQKKKFRFLRVMGGTHKGKRYEVPRTQPSWQYEGTSESLRPMWREASRCRRARRRVRGK